MKTSLIRVASFFVFGISTAAFGNSSSPFEQTQFDRGLSATYDASRSAYQKGPSEGGAAGATSQPGSHHNVQSPTPQGSDGNRDARAPEPNPKYPLQPIPDPYNPT